MNVETVNLLDSILAVGAQGQFRPRPKRELEYSMSGLLLASDYDLEIAGPATID